MPAILTGFAGFARLSFAGIMPLIRNALYPLRLRHRPVYNHSVRILRIAARLLLALFIRIAATHLAPHPP